MGRDWLVVAASEAARINVLIITARLRDDP